MIEPIQGLPDNVLAFSGHGKLTGQDYETVLVPAIHDKLKQGGKLRFLYHLGPDFTGYEGAAAWDDAKVGMHHFTDFEKIAVVTDVEWIAHSVKGFGFLMPSQVKVFKNDQLSEAKGWVAD